jgi:2-keto-4-pentenoate hydratase/2-oxohepta-3-ene-1,7-dioic acid hydratase in catechol pathway
VAGVEEIEAPVGENQTASGGIHGIALPRQAGRFQHASLVHAASIPTTAIIAQAPRHDYNSAMRIARIADESGAVLHGCPAEETGLYEELTGSWGAGFRGTGRTVRATRVLAPLDPSAVYAIGLNYRDHAAETGAPVPSYPVLFMKNPRAVTGPGAPVLLPRRLRSNEVDYEAELAVVLARDCRNATRATALDHVAGFTCANDVSARDWQRQRSGNQWCRAKSFDTFCPLGPWVVTPDELPDPLHVRIASRLNGEIMQESNTAQMIFDVPALLEFLSADTTLPAGAVILTGTPHGVGMARQPPVWLQPGDTIAVDIAGIGTLENPVAEGV